jgi:hypothetical protein
MGATLSVAGHFHMFSWSSLLSSRSWLSAAAARPGMWDREEGFTGRGASELTAARGVAVQFPNCRQSAPNGVTGISAMAEAGEDDESVGES